MIDFSAEKIWNIGNIGGSKIVMEYTEVLDKQITRKQHYVPKAYLKNFSVSNQKQNKFMLFLLMRKTQKWFQSTIFAVVLTYMIKL